MFLRKEGNKTETKLNETKIAPHQRCDLKYISLSLSRVLVLTLLRNVCNKKKTIKQIISEKQNGILMFNIPPQSTFTSKM